MTDFKEYTKLNKFENYDKEAAEELAEAMNEARAIAIRLDQLQDIFKENTELHKFVWTTADGVSTAIHKLDDEHFTNILNYIVGANRKISKSLKAEARRRNVELPTNSISARRLLTAAKADIIPGGPVGDEYDDIIMPNLGRN